MGNPANGLTYQLGRNIRARRKRLGLTQEQLAERLGITHQSLCRMEQGRIAPKVDRLPKFAECLKCSVPELFRDEAEKSFNYIKQLNELMEGLPNERQEFVVRHIAGLVALLRLK